MALLRLNPPSSATRIDFGLVQPQDLSLVTGVIETMAPSYGVQRVEPLAWKMLRVSATPPATFQADIVHHVPDPFHIWALQLKVIYPSPVQATWRVHRIIAVA